MAMRESRPVEPRPYTPPDTRRRIGFVIGVVCFWGSLYVYIPTLAVFAGSIGASLSVIGFIVAAYGFVQFVLRIPVGYLSDRTGKRVPFIIGGLAANAIGDAGMALLSTPWMLVVWRGIHGIGAASFVPLSVYFAAFFRPENATRATALMIALTSGTQVFVSLLGGNLADTLGVTSTFWAGAVFGVAGVIAMAVAGERPIPAHRPMSIRRFRRVMTVRQLLIVSGLAAINQYLTFALTMGFVPVLADRLGASSTDLGVLTTLGFLSYAIASVIAAAAAARVGERNLIVAGSVVAALAALALPLAGTVFHVYALQVVGGLGKGVVFPILMGLAIKAAPERERASAMGVFQAVYAIGMFVGPATAGAVADAIGLSGLFVFVGILALGGALVAAIALGERAVSAARHPAG